MEKTRALNSSSLQAASSGQAGVARMESTPAERFTGTSLEKAGLTKSFTQALGGVSVWGFVDQAVVSLTSFLVTACVGRLCGSHELGIYSLAVIIFWLVAGIPNALVWMPYTSRAPRMNASRRKFYLGSVTTHMLSIALVISLLLLAFGMIPLAGFSADDWFLPMCIALVPFSSMMLLREHLRRILLAEMNTSGLLKVDVPIAASQLLILAILAWSQQLSAVNALYGMAAGCAWGILWILWHRKQFRFEHRRIAAHWGYNFQFGKWLLIVSIAWLLGDASYRWMVGSFHGLSVLGQYAAAVTTVMFFNPILLTVQNLARSILANSFAKGEFDVLRQMTVRGTKLVALGFGALFLPLALYGGQVVNIFFGDEYQGLGNAVAALCLGMYLHVLSSPVEAALAALQNGRAMLVASLARLALILLAGVPLIAIYGPVGVGLAMAVSSLGAVATQWIFFRRECQHA